MALIVNAADPKGLIAAIRKAVDAKHIDTWSYDSEGDFTHSPTQWAGEAWMRPSVPAPGVLVFGIVGKAGKEMNKEIYAIYHGRFIEMLLAHFDQKFATANATALEQADVDIFK